MIVKAIVKQYAQLGVTDIVKACVLAVSNHALVAVLRLVMVRAKVHVAMCAHTHAPINAWTPVVRHAIHHARISGAHINIR